MRRNIKLPFFLFAILILTLSFLPLSHEISYWNVIRNPSFESTIQYCEHGGFETATWNAGVTYGNFTPKDGNVAIQSSIIHWGVYAAKFYVGTATYLNYSFAAQRRPIGAMVITFNFWCRSHDGSYNNGMNIIIYYLDSSTSNQYVNFTTSWTLQNLTSVITKEKTITTIQFVSVATAQYYYLDDVSIQVDDGTGQTVFNEKSEPWTRYGQVSDENTQTLQSEIKSTGSQSLKTGYMDGCFGVGQTLNYIDTNTMSYLDFWTLRPSGYPLQYVNVYLYYSDRSFDVKTVALTLQGSWQHQYLTGWTQNKFAILITISLKNNLNYYYFIDDVQLWITQAPTPIFTFNIVPSPLKQTSYEAWLRQNTEYQFIGYVHGENESLINGTYQITSPYQALSGTIQNGTFQFTLTKRVSLTGEDITEILAFRFILEYPTFKDIQIILTFYWESEIITPVITPPSEITAITYLIVPILFLFMPAFALASFLGLAGIVGGISIGLILLVIVGWFPLWTVFFMGLIIILFIFFGRRPAE